MQFIVNEDIKIINCYGFWVFLDMYEKFFDVHIVDFDKEMGEFLYIFTDI